jgi:Flp pilus assembly protein TadG
MSLVIPIIIFLVFSTIEIGVLLKHRAELSSAAQSAARLGAVGDTTSQMNQRVNSKLTSVPPDRVTREYEKRTWNADTSTWGNWGTLGTDNGRNDADAGDKIRVDLTSQHRLVFPAVMGPVFNADENNEITLEAGYVTMRE